MPSFIPYVDIAFRLHVENQDGAVVFHLRVHGKQRKHLTWLASEPEYSRIHSDGNKHGLCTYP